MDVSKLRELLTKANASMPATASLTMLHLACRRGDLKTVKFLLEEGKHVPHLLSFHWASRQKDIDSGKLQLTFRILKFFRYCIDGEDDTNFYYFNFAFLV
jgi:hypothetical protein